MQRAMFPGSFDPPSLGHLDIMCRGAALCDELVVGVAVNSSKRARFSGEEKCEMLRVLLKDHSNVRIATFQGLVVDFAKSEGISHLIRGLRAFSDFEYEFRMALANRKLSDIETVFLMADPKLAYISSTLIRDIAKNGARLHDFVPQEIEETIFSRLSS